MATKGLLRIPVVVVVMVIVEATMQGMLRMQVTTVKLSLLTLFPLTLFSLTTATTAVVSPLTGVVSEISATYNADFRLQEGTNDIFSYVIYKIRIRVFQNC